MAIKASDQISIIDLTDAFTVNLSMDSISLAGGTSTLGSTKTATVNVSAFCGATQITPTIGTLTYTDSTNVSGAVGSASNYVVPITFTFASGLAAAGMVTIPVTVTSGNDTVTIVKSFTYSISFTGATGAPGGTGAAATSVIVGNEAVSIACDKDGNTLAASTITIPFAGYQGTTRKAATVTVSGLPTGITVSNNSGATTSADGTLTLSVAASSTLGGNSTGEITLTFSCNGLSIVKKLTWAKANTGATGATGGTGTAATNVIVGNESATIACTLGGLVKAAQTITIPFAGYIGTARAACTLADPTLPSGMSKSSKTNATTSADGSFVISVAANGTLGGASVYNGEITLTFTCNGQTFTKKFSWSKALTGATGAEGAAGSDAISIAVISSNGTIFKNTAVATTLTAHVYVGGNEVTGNALTALGTIKWYKDGSSTAYATGQTLTISASDLINHATFVAQLEG